MLALTARTGRLPLLRAARAGLATASRPPGPGEKVAHGFSSPGNTGTSMEMREAVAPDENKWNAESTQMHQFSEKDRFNKARYANAQKAVGAAATPGDTSSYEALSPASSQTAPGQTHGVLHQSPETLKQARPCGEFDDSRDVGLAEEIESKPVEEAAADGQTILPGSKGGAAPGQGRGYHTSAWAAQAQGQEGQGVEEGIAPDIKYNPSEAPGEGEELDSQASRRPDPPDERAPEIHEEPGGEPTARGAPSPTGAQFQGGSVGNAEVGRSSYHTWAHRLPMAGLGSSRRGLRTQVVVRASQGEGGPSSDQGTGTASGADMASQADQAARVPPNAGAASRPSQRSGEEPESGAGASGPSTDGAAAPESDDAEGLGADEVMEQRVDHPEVGGIAS